LKVAAAKLELASEVGGSVHAIAGQVTLLPDAIIRGDLMVTSPKAPDISPEAQVLGRVVHHAAETEERSTWADWLINWLAIFSALMVLGAATVAFTSLWPNRITEKTRSRPLGALLQGIIGFVVIPLICVLLTMTVIGIPLAMVLLAFYFAGLLLSGVVVALPIGDWLLARFRRAEASWYVRLAAGALLLGFFVSLPWIGWAIGLLVMMIGFGALLVERIDAWRHPYATAT
jgi:hypothetical protein